MLDVLVLSEENVDVVVGWEMEEEVMVVRRRRIRFAGVGFGLVRGGGGGGRGGVTATWSLAGIDLEVLEVLPRVDFDDDGGGGGGGGGGVGVGCRLDLRWVFVCEAAAIGVVPSDADDAAFAGGGSS